MKITNPDNPVWFYSAIFNGVLGAVFGVATNLSFAYKPSDLPLVAENAFLALFFSILWIISTTMLASR